MNNPKKTYKDIINIISEVSIEPLDSLNLETTINRDLQIYGDDWEDLMNRILVKCPIDEFSEFQYSKHMRDEVDFRFRGLIELILNIPILILSGLIYLFDKALSKRIREKLVHFPDEDNEPLYIADIYNSVLKNKWE